MKKIDLIIWSVLLLAPFRIVAQNNDSLIKRSYLYSSPQWVVKASILPEISNTSMLRPYLSVPGFLRPVVSQRIEYERVLSSRFSLYSDLISRYSPDGFTVSVSSGLRWHYTRKTGNDIYKQHLLFSPYFEFRANDLLGYINMTQPIHPSGFAFTDQDTEKARHAIYGPHSLSLSWGFQRRIRQYFYIDASLGVVMPVRQNSSLSNARSYFWPDGKLTFGVVLPSK
jgi:hypothetical protein